MPNPELNKQYGIELGQAGREALNDAGLLETRRKAEGSFIGSPTRASPGARAI